MDFIFPTDPDEICNTLYNSQTYFSKCVGYCTFHKRYVTSHQMKKKQCLKKQCTAFIKQVNHELWIKKELQKEKKRRSKLEAKLRAPITQEAATGKKMPVQTKKRYVCIDLEMNEIATKQRKAVKGLRSEVIQLGAVMLDENYNCIGAFSTYIKPIYSQISEEITSLTGITSEALEKADIFTTAFYRFFCWLGKDDITTFCWSVSDYMQLWDEIYIKAKNHEEYRDYLKTFVDLQSVFGTLLQAKKALSLDAALKCCHLRFKGRRHTALSDALNTARIFHKLMRQKGEPITYNYIWSYTETEMSKRHNKVNLFDKDFTASIASFVSPELLEKFKYTEAKAQEEKDAIVLQTQPEEKSRYLQFMRKHLLFARYEIRFFDWLRFSLKMFFVRDMKTNGPAQSPSRAEN